MALKRPLDTIGASDIRTIAYWRAVREGKQPPYTLYKYEGPLALYARMTGTEEPERDNSSMSAGKAAEPLLTRYLVDLQDKPWARYDDPVQHQDSRRWCTPDANVRGVHDRGEDTGPWAELKAVYDSDQAERWGDGELAIPPEYYLQCQWSMMVCGANEWHLLARFAYRYGCQRDMEILWAAYHSGADLVDVAGGLKSIEFRHYLIPRNEKQILWLNETAAQFLSMVDRRERPKPLGLLADAAALRRMAEPDADAPRLPQSEEERDLIDEMEEAKSWAAEYKGEYDAAKQRLQDAAQRDGCKGIVDESGRGGAENSRGSFLPKGM